MGKSGKAAESDDLEWASYMPVKYRILIRFKYRDILLTAERVEREMPPEFGIPIAELLRKKAETIKALATNGFTDWSDWDRLALDIKPPGRWRSLRQRLLGY